MFVQSEALSDLKAMIESDFGRLPPAANLDEALVNWLHFLARSVPQRPRQVITSPEVQALRSTYPAINTISLELQIGGDITPWLSDRVRTRKADPKADMMFNDWQILHFHLSRTFETSSKIARTRPLLYAFISAERAVLLDIQPHGSWTMQALLRILLKCSPEDLTEMKGISGSQSPMTDAQMEALRGRHVQGPIEIDGRVYFSPGMGVALNGGSVRIRYFADQLKGMISDTEENIRRGSLPWHTMRSLVSMIGVPVVLGLCLRQGVFHVYDKTRRVGLMSARPLE
jgi:hypothetical protein